MRMIDGDALYEKTAEWEAQAFAYIEELNRTPLEEMTVEERAEWKRWTAILGERTAFKHDVADAPTIEIEPVKHGYWIRENKVYPELPNDGDYYWYCSECRSQDQHNINVEVPFCWHCGANMRGGEDE